MLDEQKARVTARVTEILDRAIAEIVDVAKTESHPDPVPVDFIACVVMIFAIGVCKHAGVDAFDVFEFAEKTTTLKGT